MQTVANTVATTSRVAESEPISCTTANLLKRVGSTTYVVTVRFKAKCAETLEDKLLRLIESEVTADVN